MPASCRRDHALRKEKLDITHVMVQVKLTVLSDPAKVAEIVPLISRYANSQNKVNIADFSANGKFHQNVESLSRTVWAPPASGLERGTHWYYERARGSYSDDKAAQGTPARRREWEGQNPTAQKFTKTDLAKFEHSWLGVPHLVCLGAEKNFMRFAETMDSDGEADVDQNYFRRLVAKAILFRTAEKLFSTLDLAGYRANSVAYAVAWLAVRSGWRINLDRIWESQRLSTPLCEALKIACAASHAHILAQSGNPGEASKREQCWKDFKNSEIPAGDTWLGELATSPFLVPTSEDDMLAHEWESVRHQFQNDARTVGELEAMTGKTWVASRREESVGTYAHRSWEELCQLRGVGAKKLRTLVEIFAAAAGR